MKRDSIIKSKSGVTQVNLESRREAMAELVATLDGGADESVIDALCSVFERPNLLEARLSALRPDADVKLIGPVETRMALVRTGRTWRLIAFGDYDFATLPRGLQHRLTVQDAHERNSWTVSPAPDFMSYFTQPKVSLAALYHPEVFPLPRLSLAISDLIRAARCEGVHQVVAYDMQLGVTVSELAHEIIGQQPQILGISATFGQHDVLEALLAEIRRLGWPTDCQLVFGGSLSVLNQQVLLEAYPEAVVATGPGERTIADLIKVHRGELALPDVSGIAYRADGVGPLRRTSQISPREVDDMLPELDLLDATLASKGVIQLESSRGCSYACSFCPRAHKGVWTGDDPSAMEALLPDITRILSRHPQVRPKVFLVDEEFFGYQPDHSEERVQDVALRLRQHGLRFETSSRADQVFRFNRDRAWHASRFRVWRRLVEDGLDRCLFGIESGVDSILHRFNKKTTARQNAVAIRALSLLGVPPRYTYITFDPLMTREELRATYRFLGRRDLLPAARPELCEEGIYDLVTDDAYAASIDGAAPFFSAVSYMLVSMECLYGAPYTHAADREGLLGGFNPNMGRYDASYLDADIGLFSDCAQAWVDRNFSLDYLLKSIEKYTSGSAYVRVREMRALIKTYAYDLLGLMIGLWDPDAEDLHVEPVRRDALGLRLAAADLARAYGDEARRDIVHGLMDRLFAFMRADIRQTFDAIRADLPQAEQAMIVAQVERWAQSRSWSQINAYAAQ